MTTTLFDNRELSRMLSEGLAQEQSDPYISAAEREAARWLYEQLANYRGMLYKRPLTRSIEFIVWPPSPYGPRPKDGWYYKGTESPSSHKLGALNWYGPFSSHAEAQRERDKLKPRNVASFMLSKILNDPAMLKDSSNV